MKTAAVKPVLEFDPVLHRYSYDRRDLIPVTTALSEGGAAPIFGEWARNAAVRGTAVHLAVALHHKGTLDPATIHPIVKPYFEAYLRFLKESGFRAVDVERRVYDLKWGYAGTADLIGTIKGRRCLIDLKSGAPSASHGPQTAAYAACLKGRPPLRYALYVRKDGTYRLEPHDSPEDLYVFQAALRIALWRRQHKLTEWGGRKDVDD